MHFMNVINLIDIMEARRCYRTDPQTLEPFNVFILFNGWICLHGVHGS